MLFVDTALGVRPGPRRVNNCAAEVRGVWLMAEDSRQPATKRKPSVTRVRARVTFGETVCGDMVRV